MRVFGKVPRAPHITPFEHGRGDDATYSNLVINDIIQKWPRCVLSETDGRCKFPDFLWRVTQEDTKRLWITESKYIGNGNTWESRTEVMMEEQGMVSRTKYPAPCADYEEYDKSDCFREELLHTRTCVKEKGHLTYILKQGEKGYVIFSVSVMVCVYVCMRFSK